MGYGVLYRHGYEMLPEQYKTFAFMIINLPKVLAPYSFSFYGCLHDCCGILTYSIIKHFVPFYKTTDYKKNSAKICQLFTNYFLLLCILNKKYLLIYLFNSLSYFRTKLPNKTNIVILLIKRLYFFNFLYFQSESQHHFCQKQN